MRTEQRLLYAYIILFCIYTYDVCLQSNDMMYKISEKVTFLKKKHFHATQLKK